MTADQSFAAQQGGVRKSAGLALTLALVTLVGAWFLSPALATQPATDAERMAFAFRCEIAVGFVLWGMIARIGAMRYFSPQDIGGVGVGPEGVRLAQARAALQNTVEQSLLAVIAHISLALALPADRMAVIIALVGLFVVGRIAFWFGYPKGASARAFGFALTFYPTILALSAALILSLI